jgi:hypothetical protein
MAKQTLKSLLGSSDEREQVELNLNPVALQPTIRSGGNYRVAVQDTPKTNSALQLADALRQGVGLYGQAVNIAQDKAATDVETMSEEDFDKFLTEGLDKESLNIFGYTKAYNQALAKKYYAEEMPTKLQAIAAELHKDPYKYKTPDEFAQAAIAAVNEAYDEADELLGGNVFGEQANNALKSATKADFVEKQNAVFINKLPEITRKIQSDVAFKAFSELEDLGNIKDTVDQLLGSVTAEVGNKTDASAIVTKSYLDYVELLVKEGKHAEAQDLLDAVDSTEKANYGMQGRRKFGAGNVEIFNTAEARGRIETIQDAIENESARSLTLKENRAKIAIATLQGNILQVVAKEGEEAGMALLTKTLEDLRVNRSLELEGEEYSDPLEVAALDNFMQAFAENSKVFELSAKQDFINQHTGQKDRPIRELLSVSNLKSKLGNNFSLIGTEEFQLGREVLATTELGSQLESEFETELTRLKFALHDKYASSPEADKIDKYNEEYVDAVFLPMQKWLDTRLESIVPEATAVQTQAADAGLSPEEKQAFDAIATNTALTPEEVQASQEDYLALKRAKQEAQIFITGEDGSRELKTQGRMYPIFKIDPAIPYKKAIDNGFFKDSEEQSKGLDLVYNTFNARDGVNQAPKNSLVHAYNARVNFPNEDTVLQRSEKNANVRESLSLYGVSLDEVANDSYATNDPLYNRRGGLNKPIMLSGVYGSQGPFLTTPILIDGSITNTINLVEAYFSDKDNAFIPEEAQKAAAVYGITVDVMLGQIRTYLTTNNFISK